MPGGDSDKGLGANKNEIYLSLENSTQYIDWWHEPVPDEDFDHAGNILTTVFRPGAIYGITNNINLYLTTALGVRSMEWFGNSISLHHRDEHTAEEFDNAIGGILGRCAWDIRLQNIQQRTWRNVAFCCAIGTMMFFYVLIIVGLFGVLRRLGWEV